MRNDKRPKEQEPPPTGLEQWLGSIAGPPIPGDLLFRCLGTIDQPAQTRARLFAVGFWTSSRFAAGIAAVLLIGVVGFLARPRNASAAGFLQAVQSTWTEVPACHRVVVMKGPQSTRTVETWFVRGKGGRNEVRSSAGLIGVAINNGRWEFRWDVPGHLVAAWSTALIGKRSEFEIAGLVQDNEALLRWAENHQADIHIEPDSLDGRNVRKVVLRWPGPGSPGSHPQIDTVWFDPDSLRPVKQRSELWDGGLTEARFDYPAPENVPADLLTFQMPRDVTLEINDSDLGRQVYSEPRAAEHDSAPGPAKGAK
jgi:hypothetical protein